MKTITIIIPTFNRERKIARTLASILDQDYSDVEIIVVDDGSTDGTAQVIRQVMAENRHGGKQLRYVKQDNSGACAARNRGLMLATGTYIMFLDSDDLIKPGKLRLQVEQIENQGVQCSICDFDCINDKGEITRMAVNDKSPQEFIRTMVCPHISAVVMRRDSMPPGLQWNTQLKRIQDMDFVFKYFASVGSWAHLNKPLFRYCIHGDERISDSYSKGFQYQVLKDSFSGYVNANKPFIAAGAEGLRNAYFHRLRMHRLRHVVVTAIPQPLKVHIKRLIPPWGVRLLGSE